MNELEERWRDLGEFIREQRGWATCRCASCPRWRASPTRTSARSSAGLRKPSAEILQQIARALEISSETLYVRAGILEPREGDTDLVTEIRRDPWLNEEQKKTLVQIYESFRAERRAAGFGPVDRRRRIPADPEVDDGARGTRRRPRRPESEALAGRSVNPVTELAVLSLHSSPLDPAGHGRQRRHERVRAGAGGLAGPVRASAPPSTCGAGRTTCPPRWRWSPGSGWSTSTPVPPTWPRRSCPRWSMSSPRSLIAELVHRPVDVIHANYWLSGVAGHRVKHPSTCRWCPPSTPWPG
jgi:hypothetical protein